jgi:hypothetical protein
MGSTADDLGKVAAGASLLSTIVGLVAGIAGVAVLFL